MYENVIRFPDQNILNTKVKKIRNPQKEISGGFFLPIITKKPPSYICLRSNIKDISLKNSSFLFRINFLLNILSLILKLKGIEFINSILFFLNQFIISK